MRVIDIYKFHYGTKLPLSEIPDRIHSFFRDQGLKSDRFMYYFEDMADLGPYGKNTEPDPQGARDRFSTHGCERILKDCPELGEIRYFNVINNNRYSYLTNLDGESFPEEKLLPLMNKIHRRYGFSSTFLYYSDIDFFGETVPYEPTHEPSTISNLKDDQSPDFFDCAAYWSASNSPNPGIEIYRCSLTSDNYIALSVDALHDGSLRDTTPYYKALRATLPKMRSYHETVIRLTREEKTGIGIFLVDF